MVLNFAHRGSLTEAPENTISAMKKALAHGAKAIELDVRLTKDNHLVIIHDHHLQRFNQKANKTIPNYTLDEIKQIDIGSSFSKSFSEERLATLAEILEEVPKDIVLNIEIKKTPVIANQIEAALLDCLHKHGRTENVIISSFDHLALEKVQQKDSTILIGLLLEQRLLKPWKYTKFSGLDVYSIHPDVAHVDEALISNCHRAGYAVFPYTVNDIMQYKQFVAWGVDGVFSNNPAIFKTDPSS